MQQGSEQAAAQGRQLQSPTGCRAWGQAATDPCGRGKDGGHKATPRPISADCPALPLAHPRPAQAGRCPAGATGTLLSPHLPLQPLALADSGAAGSYSSPCPHFPIQDIWVSSRLICPLIPQAGGARPHRRLPWGLPPLEDINAAPQQRALCTSQPLYQGFPTQHMGMGQPPGHHPACSRTGTRVAELCAPPKPHRSSRSPRVPRVSAAPSRLLPSLVGPHGAAKCAVKHPHHRPVHAEPKPALGQGELWARGARLRLPLQQGRAHGGTAARDPSLAAAGGSPAAGRPPRAGSPRAGSRAGSTGGSWRKAR